ncbi:MAG: lamin tail domain-containing protein [Planctomycetota bacterium]
MRSLSRLLSSRRPRSLSRDRVIRKTRACATQLGRRRAILEQLEGRRLLAGDLIFSEYIEGSSNNKAIELANLSGAPLSLDGYSVNLYSNGSLTPTQTLDLTGNTIAADDVFVIANSGADAAIQTEADVTSSVTFFNGDDALALLNGMTVIDVIGEIGVDPASGVWSDGGLETAEQTLRRKSSVTMGNPSGFNPITNLSAEWDTFPQDSFDDLGTYGTTSGPSLPDIYISELLFDPPNSGADDEPDEYVELRGTPGSTIPEGTYLVDIEGDVSTGSGNGVGDVTGIFDLGGLTFGSNGYLVFLQNNSPYTSDPAATTITSDLIGFQGLGANDDIYTGDPTGQGAATQTGLENASTSMMLIFSSVAPTLTDDADSNNNGTIDIANWSIIDGVGILDGDTGDVSYAAVTFTGGLDYVGRDGQSTEQVPNAWVGASLSGSAPGWTLSNSTPATFDGEALDHVGSENFVTPVVTGDFVINEFRANSSSSGGDFDFLELVETSGAEGASTNGLSLLRLRNDTFGGANPGEIEEIEDLSGGLTDARGFVLFAENGDNFVINPGDVITDSTLFQRGDFLLVSGFTGSVGDDLDADDDGVIDTNITLPWTTVLDAISPVPTGNGEFNYADDFGGPRVESGDGFPVSGAARVPDVTGAYTTLDFFDLSVDTPGRSNVTSIIVTEKDGANVDGQTSVTEGGNNDTIEVVLASQPTNDVTVTLTPEDINLTLSDGSLTFTSSNWDTPQTVTVTATDDSLLEGTHFRTISFASASVDSLFDNAELLPIDVTIVDNDGTIPSAVINEVRIDAEPGSLDSVNNFVEIYETSGASGVDMSGLTVVVISEEFNPGQIDFAFPLSGGSSDANGFLLLHDDGTAAQTDPTDVSVTNLDFFGSPSTILLVAGFSGSAGTDLDPDDLGFLTSPPWTQVLDAVTLEEVAGTVRYGNTTGQALSSGTSDVVPGARRVVDGTGVFSPLDLTDEGSDTPGMSNILPAGVTTTLGDGLLRESIFDDGFGNDVVEELSLSVALDAAPTANVTITLDPDTQLNLDGSASNVTFTFTPTNWFTPQTAAVSAIDDLAVEGDHDGTIQVTLTTSDSAYDALTTDTPVTDFFGNVTASIVDNDSLNHSVAINEILFDPGTQLDANHSGVVNAGDDEFVEILNTGDDPIDISGWVVNDATGTRHTFDPGTVLAAGQAIVVLGGFDDIDSENPTTLQEQIDLGNFGNSLVQIAATGLQLGNGGDTVTLSDGAQIIDTYTYLAGEVNDESLARDPDGDGVFTGTSVFNFLDFETAGFSNFDGSEFDIGGSIVIEPTGAGTSVAEAGPTSDTFGIRLGSQPTGNVTIAVSTDAEISTPTTSLTFTSSNWSTPQDITVTAVDDGDVEGNHVGLVSFVLTSTADSDYDGLTVPDVVVDVVDDDVPVSTAAVINEFVLDHTGTDTDEFIEIFVPGATGPTDISTLTLLEIDGDGTSSGNINTVVPIGTTDANGFFTQSFSNIFQNGTATLLLVEGFTGTAGDDLDSDDDGTFDSPTPWTSIIDSVATSDGGASDQIYSVVDLAPGLDGSAFQYGGASRIPDGVDTDSTSDWIRNAFFGKGLPSFPAGTADPGDAVNTPGLPNAVEPLVAGITIIETDGSTDVEEGGATDTFDVVLDAEPTADVTINLATDGETTLSAPALTFTIGSGNAPWNVPQTVTVTAFQDILVEGNHTSDVTFSVTSADQDYALLSPDPLTVNVTDDDGSSGLSPGDLIINEIMHNPVAVNDSDGEYFEIWNTTGSAIDIEGFIISDLGSDSHTINSGGPLLVAAGDFFVLGRNDATQTNGGVVVDYVYSSFFLSSADEVVISDDFGLVLDTVDYDSGDGTPATPFPTATGVSLELIPGTPSPETANDDPANWQVSTTEIVPSGDLGTPGAVNSSSASDTMAPTITDVIVASSSWTAGFINVIDDGVTGANNGLGLSLVGAGQLRNLPWLSGIDTFYIEFSEDVSASFTSANLALVGTNQADYEPFSSVTYGTDGADIGTISLSSGITADALILAVFDSLTDAAGNALDGEWTDAVSITSGNGTAGGQFNFRIDVLAGDATDDGAVNLTGDVLDIFAQNGTVPTDNQLADAFFDVNADGAVNLTGDVLGAFGLNGATLPGAPAPPTGGTGASFASVEIDDLMSLLGDEESDFNLF